MKTLSTCHLLTCNLPVLIRKGQGVCLENGTYKTLIRTRLASGTWPRLQDSHLHKLETGSRTDARETEQHQPKAGTHLKHNPKLKQGIVTINILPFHGLVGFQIRKETKPNLKEQIHDIELYTCFSFKTTARPCSSPL